MENNGFVDESSYMTYVGNQAAIMVAYYGHSPTLMQAKPIRVYTCKYCDKIFHDSRALGGHQNAHKKERRMGLHIAAMHRQNLYKQQLVKMISHALDLNKLPPSAGEEESSKQAVLKRRGDSWGKQVVVDDAAADHQYQDWPGSFHIHQSNATTDAISSGSAAGGVVTGMVLSQQQQDQSNSVDNLDLDLHL